MSARLDARFFPLVFDNISQGIFTIDQEGTITSFNRKAEEITGWRAEEAIGRFCHEVFKADMCEGTCLLKRSMATGEQADDWEVSIHTREGRPLPITISTAALVDDDGTVLGGVEMFRDLSVERELRRRLLGAYEAGDLVSRSPSMRRVFELLPLLARSDSTVLVEGDSGTGKELVARAIHGLGPRASSPFVAVNCSALPDTLLESELFGYIRGAFTDARRDKPGRFALAEDGTILLDEIGELSLPMQAKLLRVLETREYEPLGGTQSVRLRARIVASTNRDLAEEVRRKRFRQDLFFRLNVIRVTIPPLQERKEDIPLLVRHFIDRFNSLQGRRVKRVTENAMAALLDWDYPGNVRELENAIEHGFVVCAGDIIQLEDLPAHIVSRAPAEVVVEVSREAEEPAPLRLAEAKAIRDALAQNGGRRKETAAALGISRNTLWRKMKRYGISGSPSCRDRGASSSRRARGS